MVSWIVVLGALAWLLYAQLRTHVPEETLEAISDEVVSGAVGEAQAREMNAAGDIPSPPHVQAVAFNSDDEPVAIVPYAQIFPMLEVTRTVDALDRITATTIVQSTNRSMDSQDILLFLDDGEQTHQFPVGQYGMLNLPARPEWRDENLLLRSNQPEGSLSMRVSFVMAALPGPRVQYAWLWESVEQMGIAMMAMQEARVAPPGEVTGVIFEFEPGERGVVRALEAAEGIGDGAGLMADERGILRLELSAELLERNPTLVFSPMPQRMVPLLVPVEETPKP
ncbi:MAG: hypothetical protein AAGH19_09480 [Pseudomonadota bacterium]